MWVSPRPPPGPHWAQAVPSLMASRLLCGTRAVSTCSQPTGVIRPVEQRGPTHVCVPGAIPLPVLCSLWRPHESHLSAKRPPFWVSDLGQKPSPFTGSLQGMTVWRPCWAPPRWQERPPPRTPLASPGIRGPHLRHKARWGHREAGLRGPRLTGLPAAPFPVSQPRASSGHCPVCPQPPGKSPPPALWTRGSPAWRGASSHGLHFSRASWPPGPAAYAGNQRERPWK